MAGFNPSRRACNVRFGSKADICAAKSHVRFGSKADMCSAKRHVRFVPKADSCTAANSISIRSPAAASRHPHIQTDNQPVTQITVIPLVNGPRRYH
jgi:hypothetical protein